MTRDDQIPNGTANGKNNVHEEEFHVKISRRFIVMSLLSCTLLAFAVGRTARMILIDGPQERMLAQQQQQLLLLLNTSQEGRLDRVMKLPNPVLKDKPIPNTIYSSMNFDTARSSSINSRWVVVEGNKSNDHVKEETTCDADDDEECKSCSRGKESAAAMVSDHDNNQEDEEVHLPAGQHLLMDIRNVKSSFLASEEQLATAMLEVVGQCGLTLLSYHCHGLQPNGVSCVGVLLESHVSFHTWPLEGVITLDLFTCGSQSLLPIVDTMERLFGIPATSDGPETVWAYKVRGFGDETDEELTDLFTFPIGTMTEYKKEIVSITKKDSNIKNNRIDVYDVLRPTYQTYESYKRSLRNDDSYESRYKEIFQPDRILFVNGVLQSRRSAEIQYHEALVHPGMFAHSHPGRVLLLGCGGGAALREVLKHKTVKEVVMVEEEEEIVKISKEFFPEYSDCSSISGVSSNNCYDDPRVDFIYSDLYDWVEKLEDGGQDAISNFDVIILDDVYYVKGPRDYGDFLFYISKLISEYGVFVAQVGESPSVNSPAAKHSVVKDRYEFLQNLPNYGFKSVVDYEEGHLGFSRPWQFVAAFKDYNDNRMNWFADTRWYDLFIAQRIWPTISGEPSLSYFDGAVMQGYSHPSRASEVVFCRSNPESKFCEGGHGFDPERPNIPQSSLEVKQSVLGEKTGRGVFAKEDIPFFSYVALDQLVSPVHVRSDTFEIANSMFDYKYKNSIVLYYGDNYGLVSSLHGGNEIFIDSNIFCFLNHGCSGKSNMSFNLTFSEDDVAADPSKVPDEVYHLQFRVGDEYNPAAERYPLSKIRASPLRNIKADEELFINYFALSGNRWESTVKETTALCAGEVGGVRLYETGQAKDDALKGEDEFEEKEVIV